MNTKKNDLSDLQFFYSVIEWNELRQTEAIVTVLVILVNQAFCFVHVEAQISLQNWKSFIGGDVAFILGIILPELFSIWRPSGNMQTMINRTVLPRQCVAISNITKTMCGYLKHYQDNAWISQALPRQCVDISSITKTMCG